MKNSITTIVCLTFMISLFSQAKYIDPEPKGMVFVPKGSFKMKTTNNSETEVFNMNVSAFWMSNEITNSEFREFISWAKDNPDKKLYQTKYHLEVVSDLKKGTTKDTVIIDLIAINVSTFNFDMIDSLSLEKTNKDYKDYFTNMKYDDYPVVGVSFRMAQYFCLWKTMLENEQRKEKGLREVQPYRIPQESEWEYVAQQPITKFVESELIEKVNEGNSNQWGLIHFDNNVSEWVSSKKDEEGIFRGGSWKSGNSISQRQLINPDSKEPYIGFRIVRTYLDHR